MNGKSNRTLVRVQVAALVALMGLTIGSGPIVSAWPDDIPSHYDPTIQETAEMINNSIQSCTSIGVLLPVSHEGGPIDLEGPTTAGDGLGLKHGFYLEVAYFDYLYNANNKWYYLMTGYSGDSDLRCPPLPIVDEVCKVLQDKVKFWVGDSLVALSEMRVDDIDPPQINPVTDCESP